MSYPPSKSAGDAPPRQSGPPTDFEALNAQLVTAPAPFVRRTATDIVIDVFTPMMIFFMVLSPVYFLIDIRYVFTPGYLGSLRLVGFCFIMGIVALNRLIARDGSDESILYIMGLAGAVALYTVGASMWLEIDFAATSFFDFALPAAALNVFIVVFLWWMTNRLMHECCVDEDLTTLDEGMLRRTARKMRLGLAQKERRDLGDPDRRYELQPVDPTEWKKPEAPAPKKTVSASDKLSRRHPGISVLYFSVPVLFVFAVGLRVVLNAGTTMVLAGWFYLAVYLFSALLLLLLTSLGRLRQYFQSRQMKLPPALGMFWLGLGASMALAVMITALALPRPALPSKAYIDPVQSAHLKVEPSSAVAGAVNVVQQTQFVERLTIFVYIGMGTFALYAILRGLGKIAGAIARRRRRWPRIVVRLFGLVERILDRILNVPQGGKVRRRRVSRDVALSTQYVNSLGDPVKSVAMSADDHIAHAYAALCALAEDLGVPRRIDQTPFEFLTAFPEELATLRDEAYELTNLYVISAYSPQKLDARVLDRLRRFWLTYERARNRVTR